jgi:hypothetical protein
VDLKTLEKKYNLTKIHEEAMVSPIFKKKFFVLSNRNTGYFLLLISIKKFFYRRALIKYWESQLDNIVAGIER